MSYLVDHHLAVSDPFRRAHSAAQLGLLMNLTGGFTFPWRAGGVALLRRALYPTPTAWVYCGFAPLSATTIKNFPGMTHTVSQAYEYVAVRILGNGFISPASEPVRVDFDGAGDLITPRLPAQPLNLSLEILAGGKFRVSFIYDPYGQGAPPKDFQVFAGATGPTIDYGTPLVDSETGLDHVLAASPRRAFIFTTAAFANGTPHAFAVRARNSGGGAELNTVTTNAGIARSVTPVDAAAPERAHVITGGRQVG